VLQVRKSHRDSNDRGSLKSNACEAPKTPRGVFSTAFICGFGRASTEVVLLPGITKEMSIHTLIK
jgi:hypothetical protein